jgi:hypothetical protein
MLGLQSQFPKFSAGIGGFDLIKIFAENRLPWVHPIRR